MVQRRGERRAHRAGVNILVVRSGGFAGLTRQWRVEAHDDAEEWVALVRACPWSSVARDDSSRDRFVWRIEATIPPKVRTASVPDAHLVGPWRTLVDRVQQASTDESSTDE
jgi:hypothetical protein